MKQKDLEGRVEHMQAYSVEIWTGRFVRLKLKSGSRNIRIAHYSRKRKFIGKRTVLRGASHLNSQPEMMESNNIAELETCR